MDFSVFFLFNNEERVMRTMLRFTMDIEAGNKAVQEGRAGSVMRSVVEKIKPEAAYFYIDGGRSGMFIFDLADNSDIPAMLEPLFQSLNAKVELIPVMNQEELAKGIGKIG